MERALLVGAYLSADTRTEAENLLEELAELVETLSIPIVSRELISYRENHAPYLIGSGKSQEIVERAKELECDLGASAS